MLLKHARHVWEEDIDQQCTLHSQSQCSCEHNNKCKQGYFSQKRQKWLHVCSSSSGRFFDQLKNLSRHFVRTEPFNIFVLFTLDC